MIIMLRSKLSRIIFSVVAVLIFSISFFPTSFNCPPYPSVCGLTSNSILVLGGLVTITNEIKSKLLPGTDVQIEMDNGEIRKATLSRKVVTGRKVSSGDKVRLNCAKAYTLPQDPHGKVCELEFLGFDPNSACTKNSPCYGKIPGFSISINSEGTPDPELLKFH